MGKPHPIELRVRVVAFVDEGHGHRQAARHFRVSPKFVSELIKLRRETASVDWQHREASRARMRVLVKRILRKHGYPPDLQDQAVRTVLQQAEALSAKWAA